MLEAEVTATVNVIRVSARDDPARVEQRIRENVSEDSQIEVVGIGRAIPVVTAAVNNATSSSAEVVRVQTSYVRYGVPMLSVSLEKKSGSFPTLRQRARDAPSLRRAMSGPVGSDRPNFTHPPSLRRAQSTSFEPVGQVVETDTALSSVDLRTQLWTGTLPISSKALQRLTSFQGLSPKQATTQTADGTHVQRFGEEDPDFECQFSEKDTCGICFDSGKTLIRLCAADTMGEKCGGFCLECVKTYAEQNVRDALHFCPWLRCPTCRRRVPTRVWSEHVDAAIMQKYTQNAHSLLSVRCQECDEGHTLLPDADLATFSDENVFSALDDVSLDALRKAWTQFSRAEEPVDILIDILDTHYGAEGTKKMTRQRRSHIRGGGEILKLVQDIERRLSLLLAWLRRHPQIRTSCCAAKVCFKCKVAGWHPGVSCEQKQQRLYMGASTAVQPCPSCGILTQRLEGCNQISCVCGESWEWEEGEGGETAQNSRPLLCLASRCPGARSTVQLLLEHAADVNEQGEFGYAPLVYAARVFETDVVKELFLRRADPNVKHSRSAGQENQEENSSGLTALAAAIRGFRTTTVHDERFAQRIPTLTELARADANFTETVVEELGILSNVRDLGSMKDVLQAPWQRRKDVIGSLCTPDKKETSKEDDIFWLRVLWDAPASIEAALQRGGASVTETELACVAVRLLIDNTAWSDCASIANKLWEFQKPDNDTWQDLKQKAATNILCDELNSARVQGRDADERIVRASLDRKADPNCVQEEMTDLDDPWSAMHLVAAHRNASCDSAAGILKCLIEARADVNCLSGYDETPVQVAAHHKNFVAIELLLEHGANLGPGDNDEQGQLSCILACTEGFDNFILSHSKPESLPLWALVRSGNVEAVSVCLAGQIRLESEKKDKREKRKSSGRGLPVSHRIEDNSSDQLARDTWRESSSGLKCGNGHALKRSRSSMNICDLCDRTGTAYRCSQGCDWDACHACFDFCRLQESETLEGDTSKQCVAMPTVGIDHGVDEDAARVDSIAKQPPDVEHCLREDAVQVDDITIEKENESMCGEHCETDDEPVPKAKLRDKLSVDASEKDSDSDDSDADNSEGSGFYGSSMSSNYGQCWPVIAAACIRVKNPGNRSKIEELLREHISTEKFDRLVKVARMHLLRTELDDACSFGRPINEELVCEMLDGNAFCGAVEDEPFYKDGGYDGSYGDLEDNPDETVAMRLFQSSPFETDYGYHKSCPTQFIDVAHRVLKRILERSGSDVDQASGGYNKQNSGGDNILDLVCQWWLRRRMYGTCIAEIVGTVVDTGVEMTSRLLPFLKKLSISRSSREIEAKLEPAVDAACRDGRLELPLWLILRFGKEELALQRLGDSEVDLPEEVLAEGALALLQLQLREAGQDLPRPCASVALIEAAFVKRAGEDLSQQLRQIAWTTLLTLEIQEAATRQRPPDEELVREFLAKGANARALGNADGEPSDLEDNEDSDYDDDDDEDEDSEEDDTDDEDGDDYDSEGS